MKRSRAAGCAALVTICAVLAGCDLLPPATPTVATTPRATWVRPTDYRTSSETRYTYKDVKDLARATDALVVGTFEATGEEVTDRGGVPDGPGQTINLRIFHVTQGYPSGVPATVRVALPESPSRPAISEISPGKTYALFTYKVTETQRGGLQGLGDLYVPLGGEGMFEVNGSDAVAMRPLDGATQRLTIPLSQLTKATLKSP